MCLVPCGIRKAVQTFSLLLAVSTQAVLVMTDPLKLLQLWDKQTAFIEKPAFQRKKRKRTFFLNWSQIRKLISDLNLLVLYFPRKQIFNTNNQ